MPRDPGNTSNASNRVSKLGAIRLGGAFGLAAFEVVVLAEILWYFLHDGEQTLHEAFSEWLHGLRERVERKADAHEVLEQIRDLPETEQ